ncbi:MAG: 2OG-Fe(II) oxygenase [Owenweeksia sp.]|nr:2OG-Fe(II) oxygenase [Owenweeksia sp.]
MSAWHPSFTEVREMVNSEDFYQWIRRGTGPERPGIPHKIRWAQGVHQGADGSYADVHVDVNMNSQAGLWRRVNLLLYLNKNWQEEYGGHLELWDKDTTTLRDKILPAHNRAIIFYTDDNSPHGVTKVNVPEGETRKSFSAIPDFYTEVGGGFRYRDSKFKSRPDDKLSKKLGNRH